MLGVILVLAGMGLFAVFTASFASWFLSAEEHEEQISIAKLHEEVSRVREEVRSLRDDLTRSERGAKVEEELT